jgi:hypothetical protein
MPTISAAAASALWRIAVPSIVIQAGSGGAMLSITLLKPTVLTLYGGHSFVLHDPLGLMGDRLLAHVHRAVAERPAPPAAACRWVTARGPLSAVWEAADGMAARGLWRPPRRRWPEPVQRGARAPRVAESRVMSDPVPLPRLHPSPAASPYGDQPRVLLLSESDRPDALAPHTAARLLLRAVRHEWAVFAVTRQGPARPVSPVGAPISPERSAREPEQLARAERRARPWRTHLVCRAGTLEPIPVLSPISDAGHVRSSHHD